MKIGLLAAGLLTLSLPIAAAAQSEAILIFGGAKHDEFIGCLTCNEYDRDSVWNKYSEKGWSNKYGDWSPYGDHASKYSATSACSAYASDPPILVDRRGGYYGSLSVNGYADGSVCATVGGKPQICRALRVMCAGE